MPVYEPLLWTLKPVTLCPVHQQLLAFVCPFCKLQNGVSDPRTRPGHCSRCGQWLARRHTATVFPDNRALPKDGLSWGKWVATVLGEILAAAPRLSFAPSRDDIAQMIRFCIEHKITNRCRPRRVQHGGPVGDPLQIYADRFSGHYERTPERPTHLAM